MLPEPITNLITSIATLPGIGNKGSTKIVLDYLNAPKPTQDSILKSFIDVRQQITICPVCFYLSTENHPCNICQDISRKTNQIMIVLNPFDVISIETNNVFRGRYHVLNQLISPLENKMPDSTTLYDLEHRIEQFLRVNLVDEMELIYFIKHSFQSLTTYSYIADYISKSKHKDRIHLVKLATGLPSNFNIQQIDQESLQIAYENRK
jgi:recombination protein RecR